MHEIWDILFLVKALGVAFILNVSIAELYIILVSIHYTAFGYCLLPNFLDYISRVLCLQSWFLPRLISVWVWL